MARNERIKGIYDRVMQKTGKPPSSAQINRIEHATSKKSISNLNEYVNWDNVPTVMKPLDKIKGAVKEEGGRDTKRYFYKK
jgi:hypothetical protein